MTYVAPAPGSAGYPINVALTSERSLSRWWGIPFLGNLARGILAIPHYVVLAVLGIGLYVWLFVGWIPILLNGRVPGLAVRFLTEYLHRSLRVQAYVGLLAPGGYPRLEPGMPNPVDLQIHLESLEINRLWGIPFIGIGVRAIVAIPHLIVLGILGIGVALSLMVLWIPILLNGRYPDRAASFYESVMRYGVRVAAYVLLLPVPYPPFALS